MVSNALCPCEDLKTHEKPMCVSVCVLDGGDVEVCGGSYLMS